MRHDDALPDELVDGEWTKASVPSVLPPATSHEEEPLRPHGARSFCVRIERSRSWVIRRTNATHCRLARAVRSCGYSREFTASDGASNSSLHI